MHACARFLSYAACFFVLTAALGRAADDEAGVFQVAKRVTFKGAAKTIYNLEFTPNSQLIVVADFEKAFLWDIGAAKPTLKAELPGDEETFPINHARFSADGQWLVFASKISLDHRPRLWNLHGATPRLVPVPAVHAKAVDDATFSPDGKLLVTAGSLDRTVRVWDLQHLDRAGPRAKEKFVLRGNAEVVHRVAIAPNNTTLAAVDIGTEITVWDIGKDKPTVTARIKQVNRPGGGSQVFFSPDSNVLIETGMKGVDRRNNNTVSVTWWDLATQKPLKTVVLPPRQAHLQVTAYTPDVKYAALGYDDGTVALWDVATGKNLGQFACGAAPEKLAFSADKRLLAVSLFGRLDVHLIPLDLGR